MRQPPISPRWLGHRAHRHYKLRFVVTMRLAQGYCRSCAAVIAAAVVLAGAATNRLAVAVACVSQDGN